MVNPTPSEYFCELDQNGTPNPNPKLDPKPQPEPNPTPTPIPTPIPTPSPKQGDYGVALLMYEIVISGDLDG